MNQHRRGAYAEHRCEKFEKAGIRFSVYGRRIEANAKFIPGHVGNFGSARTRYDTNGETYPVR